MRKPNDTGIPNISSEYVPQPSYIDTHPLCRTTYDRNRPKWCNCEDEESDSGTDPGGVVDPPTKDGAHVSNVGGTTIVDVGTGGQIHLTKLIESTSTPNEFIIKLGVDVKGVTVDANLVPNTSASLVLIIDVSTSMNVCAGCNKSLNSVHTDGCVYKTDSHTTVLIGDTRIALACDAAENFLRQYRESDTALNEHRYASLVFFGTSADMMVDWTDVTNAADDSTEFKLFTDALANPSLQGGTFTQGGLLVGRNLWNIDRVPKVDGEPTLNRFTVLMTDGDPNRVLNSDAAGQAYLTDFTAEVIPQNVTGSIQSGNAGYAAARPLVESVAQELDKGINPCITSGVYTIAFQTGSSFIVGGITYPSAADWLKNSIATNPAYAFDADTGIALSHAFEQVMDNIRNVINAWKITDLMGDDIKFLGTVDGSGNVSGNNGDRLTWNVIDSEPYAESGSNKSYTLSYRIRYEGDSTVPVVTNAETYLMYALGDVDEMYSEVIRADFTDIPAISL